MVWTKEFCWKNHRRAAEKLAGRPFSTLASKNGEAEVAYVAQQLTEGGDVTLTDPEGGQMTPEDVREGISKGVSDRVKLRAATGPKHSKPEPIHTLRIKDCAGLGPNGWSGSVFWDYRDELKKLM